MNNNYTDYLAHHGVKGMKWGVRRYHNADGSLTEAGKKKYYDEKGNITDAGRKARNKAFRNKSVANANTKSQAMVLGAIGAINHPLYKNVRDYIHYQGNVKVGYMGLAGASYNKRKAVAAAYIAAMGAVTVAEITPAASTAYIKTRYKIDKTYRNSINNDARLRNKMR